MRYSLSMTSIIDTMQALVALRLLSAPPCGAKVLAELLMPERRPLVSALVKDAFAETLIALLPYLSDSGLGEEDDTDFLTFELSAPVRMPDGAHTVVRRSLEQSIAYRVIYISLLSAHDTDSRMADEMSGKVSFHLDCALTLLRSNRVSGPFIRSVS